MGRDHSCEVCGRGGFNDPDGRCECPDPAEIREGLIRLRDSSITTDSGGAFRLTEAERELLAQAVLLAPNTEGEG